MTFLTDITWTDTGWQPADPADFQSLCATAPAEDEEKAE